MGIFILGVFTGIALAMLITITAQWFGSAWYYWMEV